MAALDPCVAQTDLLVRAGPEQVFDAFVQPRTIEAFWLRRASAPLAPGAVVDWDFMVDGSTEQVTVTELTSPTSISFSWSDGIDVRLMFEAFEDVHTRVAITASGFVGEEAPAQAVAATAGFTIVLCDLKTLLETGRSANLVRDKALLITADAADT